MASPWEGLFRRLADREMILPYFEQAMLSDKWPDEYTVKIDSSPYYGAGDGYFHPSSHPLMGARRLYYMFHPETRDQIIQERRTLQSHMTLSMGSALHGIIQAQFQMAGLITSPDMIEVEYVNRDHHVRGRADFIVDHPQGERLLVELKTQNSYAFKKQEEIKPAWDAQLSLALDNLGVETGILMVLESGWPYQMREYRVTRNVPLLEEIYAKFDYVRECIARDTPPPHCCADQSDEMKKCPARFLCWEAPHGQAAS